MSASIYLKSGNDKTIILEARTGMQRAFNFGSWTELRMGMFFTGAVSSSGYVSRSLVGEDMVINTQADHFVMGIKSNTTDMHSTAGTNFIGVATYGTHYFRETSFAWGGYQNTGKAPCTYVGTTRTTGDDTNQGANNFAYLQPDGAVDYNGFKGIKFTLLNSGSVSQSIQIACCAQGSQASPYTVTALRTMINNSTYTNMTPTMSWNDGVNARALPNCFYIWNPYYENGIRISALDIIKVS